MNDEGFRQELREQAVFASGVIGSVQVLLAMLLQTQRAVQDTFFIVLLALGVVTFITAWLPNLYSHARTVTVCSCWLWLAMLVLAAPPALCIPTAAALVLAAAVLIPVTPREAAVVFVPVLAMGLAPEGSFGDRMALTGIAVAGIGVAVAHSVNRWSIYSANLQLLQSTQDLRLIQARALSAEHAASLERLAAALSHELNNPVGALKSGIETLLQVRTRYAEAPEERRKKLDVLQGDLLAGVTAAASRIQEIVRRLQRFSNLDRATVRPTDMNLLLRDVVAMIEAGQNPHVEIALDLQPVPTLLCETQAWNTIFTTLLSSAVQQCQAGGVLAITSGHRDSEIFVEVALPGCARVGPGGVDPDFVAEGGRVGTGNWSLFHIRMWIQQQGATLRQSSDPERGLVTRISISAGSVATAGAN